MPYNDGKKGVLNQPATDANSKSAQGYYGVKDTFLYAKANEYPGFVAVGSATGGTITTVNTYKVHTFTSSGTLTVSGGTISDVEYLVVAGGGGTCNNFSGGSPGGAGAGGYRCSVGGETSGGGGSAETKLSLPAGDYTVTVGAGGAAITSGSDATNNGNDSVLAI